MGTKSASLCQLAYRFGKSLLRPTSTFSASYSAYHSEIDLGTPCRILYGDARGLSMSGSVNALERDSPNHQRIRKIKGRTVVLYDFMSRQKRDRLTT